MQLYNLSVTWGICYMVNLFSKLHLTNWELANWELAKQELPKQEVCQSVSWQSSKVSVLIPVGDWLYSANLQIERSSS